MNKLFYKLILLSFIISCISCSKNSSSKKDNIFGNKEYADAFVSQIKPKWFTSIQRFSLIDRNKNALAHRFFDVAPFKNLRLKTLNSVIVTPEGSDYLYDLDVSSGQIFTAKKFCPQRDEYKKYEKELHKPNFSIGIVPRVLDQLNLPQKIIVFGAKDYLKEYHLTHYFDVRVVGGYIEKICPYGGCVRTDEWLSRLVLIAVQSGNQMLRKVKNLKDVQENFDWDYAKAFIENGEGKNKLIDNYFPRKKVGALVSGKDALNYIVKNSTIFNKEKINSLRLSCYKLYDHMWKDLNFVNASSKKAVTKEEIRQKAIEIKQGKMRGKKDISFSTRFARNMKKFGEQFKTCTKYVYPSNINDDPKRHWFFAYVAAFYKLHDLGYAYDCSSKNWNLNPLVSNGRRMRSLRAQFSNCSAGDLNRAFEFSPSVFKNIAKKNRKSYRYIDYDKGITGTHMKVYNWVSVDPGVLTCPSKADRKFNSEKKIFPKDIKWQKRGDERKGKNSNGVIF